MRERDGIVGIVGARDDGCEVVCTLPETSLGERRAMVELEILPHVRARARISDGFRLDFPRDSGVRRKLERWAELEERCCREARFEIDEREDRLQLTVHGIDPAGSALAAALDDPGAAPARGRSLAGLLQAGGAGALGAFALLCVLPMGLAAVAGASVAAPLARLESPPALAGAALAIGGGFWWWRHRHAVRRRRSPGSSRSGRPCSLP